MGKIKISEIAADIAKNPKDVFEKAKEMGLNVKNITSSVDEQTAVYLSDYVLFGINNMPKPTEKKSAKTKDQAKSVKDSSKKTEAKPVKKSIKKDNAPLKTEETPPSQESIPTKSLQKPKINLKEESDQPKKDQIQESIADVETPKQEVEFKKDSTLIQRNTGIRIVKKTTASSSEPKSSSSKKSSDYAPSVQEIMEQEIRANEEGRLKKTKKPKKVAVSHKGNEQKIEFLGRNLDIQQDDYDEEQDEIMLFDFGDHQIIDEEKENEVRQTITDRVKIQRKNPWLNENRSISRSRRKKPQKQTANTKVAKTAIIITEEIRIY